MTKEILHRLHEDEEYIDLLINRLTNEAAKNNALLDKVEALSFKAWYYDNILQSDNVVQAGIIAKDYGMTALAFNKLLHGLKVQYKIGDTWLLYKDYADKGYTLTKTYHVNDRITKIHTYWTQKGRFFLYDLLRHNGILPSAEKDGCPFIGGVCNLR